MVGGVVLPGEHYRVMFIELDRPHYASPHSVYVP